MLPLLKRRQAATLQILIIAVALTASAQEATNVSTNLEKKAFEIMVRKNIFDPNRTPPRGPGRPRPRVETFTFCGAGFDGPQAVALFSGEGAPRRPLLPGDSINGFKIGAVTFNSVELKPAEGAAEKLIVGSSMRREDGGPWKASDTAAAAPEADTPTEPAATSSTINPNDSDIIKRLKAKREEN